jgi:hypothetical protein
MTCIVTKLQRKLFIAGKILNQLILIILVIFASFGVKKTYSKGPSGVGKKLVDQFSIY